MEAEPPLSATASANRACRQLRAAQANLQRAIRRQESLFPAELAGSYGPTPPEEARSSPRLRPALPQCRRSREWSLLRLCLVIWGHKGAAPSHADGSHSFDSEGFQLVSARRSCRVRRPPSGGSPGSASGIPVSISIWDALQEDTESPDIDLSSFQHPTQAAALVNEEVVRHSSVRAGLPPASVSAVLAVPAACMVCTLFSRACSLAFMEYCSLWMASTLRCCSSCWLFDGGESLQGLLQLGGRSRFHSVHALPDFRTQGGCAAPHLASDNLSDGRRIR